MDEGEELEERMKAISDVLKTNVSKEERASFQFLFRELQQQKAALQKKKLGNLLAKLRACLIVTLLRGVLVGDSAGGHHCGQSFASTLHFCQSGIQVKVKVVRYSSFKAPTQEEDTASGHNGDRLGTFRRSTDPTDSHGEDGTFKDLP